jgi:hypothetical protein
MIDGIKPDEKLHDFILHFQALTGVPISGKIRFQLSFFVEQFKEIE